MNSVNFHLRGDIFACTGTLPLATMSEEPIQTSNELVRWLKLLSLPTWAKSVISVVMALALLSATALLGWAVWQARFELVAPAISVLTIGLPVGLVVIALVFGDGGAEKLKRLTHKVLAEEIPTAVRENLGAMDNGAHFTFRALEVEIQGCIAEYRVKARRNAPSAPEQSLFELPLKLELNVKKANFVVWIPVEKTQNTALASRYQSCFFGASREGYVINETPILGERLGKLGFVFIKNLKDDFLLNPGERLYFSQDLAFFIRGLLSAEFRGEQQ